MRIIIILLVIMKMYLNICLIQNIKIGQPDVDCVYITYLILMKFELQKLISYIVFFHLLILTAMKFLENLSYL